MKVNLSKYHRPAKAVAAIALALGAAGFLASSQAASTSGTFNVNITLNSSCTLGTVSAVDFTYDSLGGAVNSTGGAFNVTCTGSLPYTFGLQAGNAAAVPPGSATINVTDNGVNLNYTLSLSAAGGSGDGTAQGYSVNGSMIAGQAGTCALASCTNSAGATTSTNRVNTLILNY